MLLGQDKNLDVLIFTRDILADFQDAGLNFPPILIQLKKLVADRLSSDVKIDFRELKEFGRSPALMSARISQQSPHQTLHDPIADINFSSAQNKRKNFAKSKLMTLQAIPVLSKFPQDSHILKRIEFEEVARGWQSERLEKEEKMDNFGTEVMNWGEDWSQL